MEQRQFALNKELARKIAVLVSLSRSRRHMVSIGHINQILERLFALRGSEGEIEPAMEWGRAWERVRVVCEVVRVGRGCSRDRYVAPVRRCWLVRWRDGRRAEEGLDRQTDASREPGEACAYADSEMAGGRWDRMGWGTRDAMRGGWLGDAEYVDVCA